jgi:hypothetical protein
VADFASLTRTLEGLAGEFDGTNARKRLEVVARQTAKDVDEAVRADLGDQSMSGWRRGSPIPVTGDAKVVSDNEISVSPMRRALGPMRVLEQGRQSYSAGDRRTSGSYVSKKTGERKQKTRKVKRNTKATAGKGTWSDAVLLMQGRVGQRMDAQVVDAIRSHIGRG